MFEVFFSHHEVCMSIQNLWETNHEVKTFLIVSDIDVEKTPFSM